MIRFSQADDLWQQWETIFTDLSNDDREADALAFFQAHKTAMLEAPRCCGRRSCPTMTDGDACVGRRGFVQF